MERSLMRTSWRDIPVSSGQTQLIQGTSKDPLTEQDKVSASVHSYTWPVAHEHSSALVLCVYVYIYSIYIMPSAAKEDDNSIAGLSTCFPRSIFVYFGEKAAIPPPLFVDWFAGCRTLPLNIIMQMTCDYSLIWWSAEWEHTIGKWQPLWQAPRLSTWVALTVSSLLVIRFWGCALHQACVSMLFTKIQEQVVLFQKWLENCRL